MPLYVLEPPARFDHPYAGPVIERVLPLGEARAVCAGKGTRADACSWVIKGTCYLVIPRNGQVKDLRAYVRHERAHCNGWSHGQGNAAHVDAEQPTPAAGVEGVR